jgi:CheY-like chemotaxis protein
MLLAEVRPESGDRRRLELIRLAGERATNLTMQLLAFSRKQATQKRIVDLNLIVAEVLELSRRLIGENITLTEILEDTPGLILADPAQINQMLMNLVINARDAMAGGGRLTITSSGTQIGEDLGRQLDVTPGEYVLLTVTDTGAGMGEEVLSHAFEPFFTTKEVGKGTGLGLATVYGIVRQGQGAITVESFPGRGCVFRIYFPRINVAPNSTADEAPAMAPARSASTILLVEDERSVREFAAEVLADAGYTVLQAANGDEALALARQYLTPIHLLFTDVVMPGMNGHDVATLFTSLHHKAKVLFASGYDEALAARRSLDPDINFLSKPFTSAQLTSMVGQILSGGE